MKALVLAAGKGERLRPLTETIPKPMLELGGPAADSLSADDAQAGGNNPGRGQRLPSGRPLSRPVLAAASELGVEITYAPETMLLGTGGPLRGLRGFFGSEPFIVANSDTVMDLDLRAMIEFHRSSGALATFALCRPADMSPYSQLEIDADGRLRRIRLLTGGPGGGFEDFPAGAPG